MPSKSGRGNRERERWQDAFKKRRIEITPIDNYHSTFAGSLYAERGDLRIFELELSSVKLNLKLAYRILKKHIEGEFAGDFLLKIWLWIASGGKYGLIAPSCQD